MHKILSLARLPVPTLPRVNKRYSIVIFQICQHIFINKVMMKLLKLQKKQTECSPLISHIILPADSSPAPPLKKLPALMMGRHM